MLWWWIVLVRGLAAKYDPTPTASHAARGLANASYWSAGRERVFGGVEGGYRFATPWLGLTPYAAGQFTTFALPAYAEQVVAGSNAITLSYAERASRAARSEPGRAATSPLPCQTGLLTLRGCAAWAHDFDSDRSIAATFQALPGASFVVNGAAQASDSALTTASAEMNWVNGWSAALTFEGEFSQTDARLCRQGRAALRLVRRASAAAGCQSAWRPC
jgi:uncharacterized protein with beta-barrel porin domain